jgi:DNA-binding NarL/FixJ family response regulator
LSPSLVLVAPHEALRQGLELLLGRAGCPVLGSTPDPDEGEALIARLRPDVALVDMELGDQDGISLARRVQATDSERAVVLYAGAVSPLALQTALESGVRGIALKDGAPGELLELLVSVAQGATCVDARLGRTLLAAPAQRIAVLSRRESEVIDLLSRGLTGEQIAGELVLSIQTVKTHVRNAMAKLEASTRAHAIAIAIREGYIPGRGERAAEGSRQAIAA